MGNSASLPSLDSIGRPFGTERSPLSSFRRHVDRQTEARSPVERLESEVEAGGRRRSRSRDQARGHRDEGGGRTEVQGEGRRRDGSLSRRRAEGELRREAQARREALSPDTKATRAQGVSQTPGDAAQEPDESFAGRLKAQVRGASQLAASPQGRPSDGPEAPDGGPTLLSPAPLAPTTRNSGPAPAATIAGGSGTHSRPAFTATNPGPIPTPDMTEAPKKSDRAPGPAADARLAAREGERSAQVLEQFRMHLHPGLRSATLHLSPAELGRLSIRIRIDSQRVQAVLRAESPEALSALERHLPELEAAFADQGFEGLDLELGLASDEHGRDPFPASSQDASANLTELVENQITPGLGIRTQSNAIGVDTYA
jgi:hypothetical protein